MIIAGCDVGSPTAKAFIMNEEFRLAGKIIKNVKNRSETKSKFCKYY